jgi:predicted nucleic acid-binding protein
MTVLVDTSVWVDFLRQKDAVLSGLLEAGDLVCHPFVIGELACGRLHPRGEILERLSLLPAAPKVTDAEALAFIEMHRLPGLGLGLVDVHLLASAVLGRAALWTRDTRLRKAAETLGVGFTAS